MKTRSLFISLLVFLSGSIFSQGITGEWNGVLNVRGMKLRLVFHVSKADNGFTATMDSPDQGAKGIAMTSAAFANNELTITYDAAKIKYTGTLITPDSISGTFNQMGQNMPLSLTHKAAVIAKQIRPQEPTKPYPYTAENVTFSNTKQNVTLAGTLTLPAQGSNFPVVVLITGSGPQNRDEELMGHKPFLILSDYLTRKGIAVLRYDDRGCFESKGDFSKATTNDLATDVEAAVAYLKTRKEINPAKIGLIGHSEGGIIAPMVATQCKDVAFVVMMAGTAIPGSEILLRQQDLIGRANGMSENDLKTTADVNSHIYKLVDEIQNTDTLKAKITSYLLSKSKELKDMKIPEGSSINEMIDMQLKQLISPWMLNFIRYNPAPTLEKVKCPLLAINGTKDLQVPADVNIPAIEKALKKAGNKQFSAIQLPGLNHLFQECKTGSPTEYGEIEQTISPLALETISSWIKTTIK